MPILRQSPEFAKATSELPVSTLCGVPPEHPGVNVGALRPGWVDRVQPTRLDEESGGGQPLAVRRVMLAARRHRDPVLAAESDHPRAVAV